jgi:hypothetical protein
MGGNFLKLYFFIFENSQGGHNSLIVNIFFGISFITYKVSILKN